MRRRLVCPVSESRRKAGQSKRRRRVLRIEFRVILNSKILADLPMGCGKGLGQAVVEFCRESRPKNFSFCSENEQSRFANLRRCRQ